MRNALWVFLSKRGELQEGNRENVKHKNGNDDNSNTCGGKRKIGVFIVQRIPKINCPAFPR